MNRGCHARHRTSKRIVLVVGPVKKPEAGIKDYQSII